MRPALAAVAVFAVGCSFQTYAIPQPWFRTQEVREAYARALKSVEEHCGGVQSENAEAGVVVGKWQMWNAADGLSLSQCMVTVFPPDGDTTDVRITFVVKKCPVSDMSGVEALLPSCERADVVAQLVATSLDTIAKRLEADIKR